VAAGGREGVQVGIGPSIVDPQENRSIQRQQVIHLLTMVGCVSDHNNYVKTKSQPFDSRVGDSGLPFDSKVGGSGLTLRRPGRRPVIALQSETTATSKGPGVRTLTHSTAPSPAFEDETWRRSGSTLSPSVSVRVEGKSWS
jgi:hypothetical protein